MKTGGCKQHWTENIWGAYCEEQEDEVSTGIKLSEPWREEDVLDRKHTEVVDFNAD
jgi:hypothetical protein